MRSPCSRKKSETICLRNSLERFATSNSSVSHIVANRLFRDYPNHCSKVEHSCQAFIVKESELYKGKRTRNEMMNKEVILWFLKFLLYLTNESFNPNLIRLFHYKPRLLIDELCGRVPQKCNLDPVLLYHWSLCLFTL